MSGPADRKYFGLLAAGGVAARLDDIAVRAANLPGADRRFTGSKPAGGGATTVGERLVAPGRRGFQWVKWVDRVDVRADPDPAQWVVTLVSGFD